MTTLNSNTTYFVMILGLGTLLTACGDNNNVSANAGMRVQEGGRDVVSDTSQSNFLSCGSGTNYQNPPQNYQGQTGYNGQINIEYASNSAGNQYPAQNYNNSYNQNTNLNNQWAGGGYSNLNQPYYSNGGNNGTYNNTLNYGSRVSISIVRGNAPTTQPYPASTTTQPYGYFVGSINITGIQQSVTASQCSITAFNESSNTLSGTVSCQSNQQPAVTISFSCQRRG